jgi:RNA polymerase sigma-70 factor (ECF subfamily)
MRSPVLRPPVKAGVPAFDTIAREHRKFIMLVLARFRVPGRDLEDVTQEVLLLVSRRLHWFDPSRAPLRSWLYGIARRAALFHAGRSSGHREELVANPSELQDVADSARSPEEGALHGEGCRLLEKILDEMDPKHREVLEACELLEMTVLEAAEALGIPPNTVKSRLRDGREKFQAAVERYQAHQKWLGASVLPFTAASLFLAERTRLLQMAEDSAPRIAARIERTLELAPLEAKPFRLPAGAGSWLGGASMGAVAGAAAVLAALWPFAPRAVWAQRGSFSSVEMPAVAASAGGSNAGPETGPQMTAQALAPTPLRAPMMHAASGCKPAAGAGTAVDRERILLQTATIALANGDAAAAEEALNQAEIQFPDGPLAPSRRALQHTLRSLTKPGIAASGAAAGRAAPGESR